MWKMTISSAAGLVLAASLALGQAPQPAVSEDTVRPEASRRGPGPGERGPRGERWGTSDRSLYETAERERGPRETLSTELVEQIWPEVEQNMGALTPKRLERFEELPPGEFKERLRARIVSRYLDLQKVRQEDPTLYIIMSRQLEIEDELFRHILAARRPGAEEVDREELRSLVNDLVQLNVDERRHRVKLLEQALNEERKRLTEDIEKQDEVVDKQLERWMHAGTPGHRRGSPRQMRERPQRD